MKLWVYETIVNNIYTILKKLGNLDSSTGQLLDYFYERLKTFSVQPVFQNPYFNCQISEYWL